MIEWFEVLDLLFLNDDGLFVDFKNWVSIVFYLVFICRMGCDFIYLVIDSWLKVYGIDWLRIVDVFVFLNIMLGNINVFIMMFVLKGVDIILEDYRYVKV